MYCAQYIVKFELYHTYTVHTYIHSTYIHTQYIHTQCVCMYLLSMHVCLCMYCVYMYCVYVLCTMYVYTMYICTVCVFTVQLEFNLTLACTKLACSPWIYSSNFLKLSSTCMFCIYMRTHEKNTTAMELSCKPLHHIRVSSRP